MTNPGAGSRRLAETGESGVAGASLDFSRPPLLPSIDGHVVDTLLRLGGLVLGCLIELADPEADGVRRGADGREVAGREIVRGRRGVVWGVLRLPEPPLRGRLGQAERAILRDIADAIAFHLDTESEALAAARESLLLRPPGSAPRRCRPQPK
jgi:hypothetical protein